MSRKGLTIVVIYILFLVIELTCLVPYQKVQVFVSEQNVPHTEVIGSGYTSLVSIADDDAALWNNKKSAIGKIVDTQRLTMNIVLTTLSAVALYYTVVYKQEHANSSTKQ